MSLADSIRKTASIARCVSEAATAPDMNTFFRQRKTEARRGYRFAALGAPVFVRYGVASFIPSARRRSSVAV